MATFKAGLKVIQAEDKVRAKEIRSSLRAYAREVRKSLVAASKAEGATVESIQALLEKVITEFNAKLVALLQPPSEEAATLSQKKEKRNCKHSCSDSESESESDSVENVTPTDDEEEVEASLA